LLGDPVHDLVHRAVAADDDEQPGSSASGFRGERG
jgi:hypothetical protein